MTFYHAKDEWFFGRGDNGRVIIQRRSQGEVFESVTLDADTWCSIVASVSDAGETANTFGAAWVLHGPLSDLLKPT